jgi:hypothetical protein
MTNPIAGARDDVAADVAGAVTSAEARYSAHEQDTYGQGSVIGDLMDLPPTPAYTLPPPPVGGMPFPGDEPVDAG